MGLYDQGGRRSSPKRESLAGSLASAVALTVSAALGSGAHASDIATDDAARAHIVADLESILNNSRGGQDPYMTVWDSNAYIQCGKRQPDEIDCEAAGTRMQPSLARILTPERESGLGVLGWRPEPNFGNFAQSFSTQDPPERVAEVLFQSLQEGYGARSEDFQYKVSWIAHEPCPPRNGFSQNLGGVIDDAPEMAPVSIHACAYEAPERAPVEPMNVPRPAVAAADLVRVYGPALTRELQRLSLHLDGPRLFSVFETPSGYLQCETERGPDALYCEAESEESWPELKNVLAADRLGSLHKAGFADPGLRQNFSRDYLAGQIDAARIAQDILTILHDVYGYGGAPRIQVNTESGRHDLL